MMGTHCWWGPGWNCSHPFSMLMSIVFWVLVIYGLFVLILTLRRRSALSAGKDRSSIDILKRRYARGEIDAAEFARKKEELEG